MCNGMPEKDYCIFHFHETTIGRMLKVKPVEILSLTYSNL